MHPFGQELLKTNKQTHTNQANLSGLEEVRFYGKVPETHIVHCIIESGVSKIESLGICELHCLNHSMYGQTIQITFLKVILCRHGSSGVRERRNLFGKL